MWGGGRGGFRIFPELGVVLGCHIPNFRSLGQSLHIDNFCKNDGGGGGGGVVKILKAEKAPCCMLVFCGFSER